MKILTMEDQQRLIKEAAEKRAARVPALRAVFDGAIRYSEMLMDHPEWTDEQCIAFARKWHAKAVDQFKSRGLEGWNLGIPYCRNDITKANLGR